MSQIRGVGAKTVCFWQPRTGGWSAAVPIAEAFPFLKPVGLPEFVPVYNKSGRVVWTRSSDYAKRCRDDKRVAERLVEMRTVRRLNRLGIVPTGMSKREILMRAISRKHGSR